MLPRERVIEVIEHRKPDRVPVYGWLKANLEKPIAERFGSVEAFEDYYEFDFAHIFGGPHPYFVNDDYWVKFKSGTVIEPEDVLDLPLCDPDDEAGYDKLKELIRHHKEERGRFVYVQTPGIFECLNATFKIENHLAYLIEFEKELREVYRKQAEWNRRYAMNCLDLGVDMIHVSDDWGAQTSLMFSPATWETLIKPYHKMTCDAVKQRGAYLSLHSDGNVTPVLDGIMELGYDVLHPFQESAGMSLEHFKENYAERLTVMGGLDVQTTLGFGKRDRLKAEIERLFRMFRDGGLMLCTTHFVQEHCAVDELVFAYGLISELNQKCG